MDADTEMIRAAAASIGVDLTDDEVADYGERASKIASAVAVAEPEEPDVPQASSVREGEDAYGAIRSRFELPTAGDGPLSGYATGVKDNIAVAGAPITCGSAGLRFTPSHHASVVRRLRAAGADVVATTNMDEMAYFVTGEYCAHGRVTNPRVEGHVPGGSSSGSAAAVAGSVVDVALGSDTGGSIRIPASFCGVVGFKPTHRLVPRDGLADLAPSLDVIGPLANSVEDASRVLEAVAGRDSHDPSTHASPAEVTVLNGLDAPTDSLRVGVVVESLECSTTAVSETVQRTLDELRATGVAIEEVSLPSFTDVTPVGLRLISVEFAQVISNWGHSYGTGTGYSEEWREAVSAMREAGGYSQSIRDSLVTYRVLDEMSDGSVYVGLQNARRRFTDQVTAVFDDCDALITPTTPVTAPASGSTEGREDIQTIMTNTIPFNLTGNPALTVPCGTVDGKPVGLQIVTPWYDEAVAATLGRAIETL